MQISSLLRAQKILHNDLLKFKKVVGVRGNVNPALSRQSSSPPISNHTHTRLMFRETFTGRFCPNFIPARRKILPKFYPRQLEDFTQILSL